ncbi:MAG TPA: hypothetical protein VHO24_05330 [Opitutaceae bacterium]|nr:hypothetical protein [Opitutaceae bacterium]
MHAPFVRPAFLIFTLALLPGVFAAPADDAVAAVLKLRSQPGYSWDVTIGKPGSSAYSPPRTKHGAMTSEGEMVVEQIWPDGRTVEIISRSDGAAVVRATKGWATKRELSDVSRTAKRGSSEASWLKVALAAFEFMTPEEELTRLLNEAKNYTRAGDKIEAELTDRGASFWLGSARMIPDATGTLNLRLRDGLIRECRISAEGDKNMGTTVGSKTTSIAFECHMTFSYSTPPAIPFEAKQKLNDASAR